VITQPDRAGRGRKFLFGVKARRWQRSLKYTSRKDSGSESAELLRRLASEGVVIIAYGQLFLHDCSRFRN